MQALLQNFVDAWPILGDAFLAALIAGAVLGWLGVYVVERRMVFVAAAITQIAAVGVALGYYLALAWGWTFNPLWSAAILTALAIILLAGDQQNAPRDAWVGGVFAAASALAVLLEAHIKIEAHDIHAILFGSAVLVSDSDLKLLATVAAIVSIVHIYARPSFAFVSFDPVAAHVHKLPVRPLNLTLLSSLGLMVGIGARALGAMPVFAFVVLAPLATLNLANSFSQALWLAALLGAGAGAGGYFLAFCADTPVGATQVLLGCALWLLAALLAKLKTSLD